MKGIGLVFAGGGGKGSYEIGVWKYLHEIGLDQYVRAVSGTSVGALNAALFVGSTYENAEHIWLNISKEKILTPRKISIEDIMKWLAIHGLGEMNPITMVIGKTVAGTVFETEKIAQLLLARIRGDHMFSREGMKKMIYDGLNYEALKASEIPCFVTCTRCKGLRIERFELANYTNDDITKLLLASSAIPIIFPNEEFRGHKYCDGGIPVVGDNIPVDPIYDLEVENIIVVYLSREVLIDKAKYPKSRIFEIVPQNDLGDAILGTLDFSPEGAAQRLKMGYEDARRVMQPLVDTLVLKAINEKVLKDAQNNNTEFEKEKQFQKEEKRKIKDQMENDGFDSLYNSLVKEN